MKQSINYIRLPILILFLVSNLTAGENWPVLKGPYLGQKPPGKTPEIFAPGIVSKENYTEVLDIYVTGKWRIKFYRDFPNTPTPQLLYNPGLTTELKNGKWTLPSPVIYFNGVNNPEMSIIPDENIISFAHNRSIDGTKVSPNGFDIWIARKTKDGKHKIRWLGSEINSKQHDSRPSITKDGTIYFYSTREGGMGSSDIYVAKLINGKYSKVENIGHPVNTKYGEADPYVAQDESYLVFCSASPLRKRFGKTDLFITFKQLDNSWSKPINMGSEINTSENDDRPMLTKDGKYMFFSRENHGTLDIYWVSTKIIKELKPKYEVTHDQVKKNKSTFNNVIHFCHSNL